MPTLLTGEIAALWKQMSESIADAKQSIILRGCMVCGDKSYSNLTIITHPDTIRPKQAGFTLNVEFEVLCPTHLAEKYPDA